MDGKVIEKHAAISSYTTAHDGYVIAEEIWIKVGKDPQSFSQEVNRINGCGVDVVDEDYEDIYREGKRMDRLEGEDEDAHKAIVDDLKKKYKEKTRNGSKSILADNGFSRGVQPAKRARKY